MSATHFDFELITETFAHGAYQTQNFNRPELRSPSVKGMIRWWHEALGFSSVDSRAIFGSVANKRDGTGNQAAAVSIRIRPLESPSIANRDFMPHKGHRGGSKNAILPGARFRLTITPRRGGLTERLEAQLLNATKAWLLLGSIGQRSNRAAGSIQWEDCPPSLKEFEITASEILNTAKVRFAFLPLDLNADSSLARSISGDFLKDEAFQGLAPFGSARPRRKPSPLKLKCVRFDHDLHLLAVWDCRLESPQNLRSGISVLVNSDKKIGRLLEAVLPRLTA